MGDDSGRHGDGGDCGGHVAEALPGRMDPNPGDMVGWRVKQHFSNYGDFVGTIVAWDPECSWYTVEYDDGDREDVTTEAALQMVERFHIEELFPPPPPLTKREVDEFLACCVQGPGGVESWDMGHAGC